MDDLFDERKSIYCILFLSLLLSTSSKAFQADFASDNIRLPDRSQRYETRFMANAPYSYCEDAGISRENCLKLGLRFDQPTFQRLSIFDDFNTRFNYNMKTAEVHINQVEAIENSYYLPPYEYDKFKIPTEGQLSYLLDKGFIPRGRKGTKYFVRQGDSNPIRAASLEEGYGNYTTARLYRLVSNEIPDICQDYSCRDFVDKRAFVVKFRSNCKTSWNWRVEYNDKDGNRIGFNGYWEGQYDIPEGAYSIDVMARQGVLAYAKRLDIQTLHRAPWTATECYRLEGTCAVYSLANIVPCW